MRANGYSRKDCEMFRSGFPPRWQCCNQHYPKATSSRTECRPSSSYTSISDVDLIQFYLDKCQVWESFHSNGSSLISEPVDSIKSSSHNDAASQKTSYLSNGAPRFEEYTCDGDIAPNENAAASNDDGERHEAICNEVDEVEMHLTAGRALRERDDGVIDTNASLVHTVECANDAGNEEADNAPPTSTFEECTCVGDISTNGKAAALNSDSERYAALSKEVDNMETEFTAGSTSCESGHCGIDANVSLAFTLECANDVVNEESGNAPPANTCDQRTPDALEVLTERMSTQLGAGVSEASPVRRLRSGKVFETPSGGPVKSGHKRKKIQHEASKNMDSSTTGIVAEDKQESGTNTRRRRGRPVKARKKNKAKRRKAFAKLFSNWA